ncbi:MAG: T9SS type A sorting domain-containing protein [Candidatus Paceibacterota bacterium]|jgi:hypothetical protein
MKKLNLFIIAVIINFAVFFLPFNLFAQNIKWQKSFGGILNDCAQSIQKTIDGGFIVVGYTNSNDSDVIGNHGTYDFLVIKLDSLGNILWQKCFGGMYGDVGYSIQQTTDGGYVVAGVTSSNDGDMIGNHGGSDCLIIKLDALGDIQWQKCIGGSGNEEAYFIQKTFDGGYIFSGFSSSNDGEIVGNHGGYDYLIVKLNYAGNIQWQKSLGGSGDDVAYCIKQTTDSGYVVAGYSQSNNGDVTGNIGSCDYWIVKLNSTGSIVWEKNFGGINTEFALSIEQTSDEGFIISGMSNSNDGDVIGNHGGTDCLLLKLNSGGDIQWEKSLGGTGADYLYNIRKTLDKGYIAVGYSNSDSCNGNSNGDLWIVKMDSLGNILWQKCFGGSDVDIGYCIEQIDSNSYIFSGMSGSSDVDLTNNHGNTDFWVVKLSSNFENIENINLFSNIEIYPNPAENFILIKFSASKTDLYKIRLFNLLGQVVLEKNFQTQQGENQLNLRINEIPVGVYLICIQCNENSFIKIVVKK